MNMMVIIITLVIALVFMGLFVAVQSMMGNKKKDNIKTLIAERNATVIQVDDNDTDDDGEDPVKKHKKTQQKSIANPCKKQCFPL